MSDNISVVVRVRPLLPRESGDQIHWKVKENSIVQESANATYNFDKVYDADKISSNIYDDVVHPIVHGALNGYNGTIFAYGQTSSGKTHTMVGDGDEKGIIPMTIANIFQGIEETQNRQYLIRASYMEIYNENIADLLTGRSNIPGNKSLAVREDPNGVIYVSGLTEEYVTNDAELLEVLQKGNRRKQTGCTNMNDRSSRSHTIFRIIVESRVSINENDTLDDVITSSDDNVAVTVSHLNLVDLAGSENAAQTGATGDRLKEGSFINKSLFMLGRVISQLSEQEPHINFRDSKLTRILQSSLGGNAQTTIICTVTPASVEQTHSTLRFASRAKNVKNKPVVNELLSDAALLKRMTREISKLKNALEEEKTSKQVEEVKEKLELEQQMNLDLKTKIRLLNEKLVTSSTSRTPAKLKKKAAHKRRETWAAPAGLLKPLRPLDLAGINVKFYASPLEKEVVKKTHLSTVKESVSECSFSTAMDEEFSDATSSFLKTMDRTSDSSCDSPGESCFKKPTASRKNVCFSVPELDDEDSIFLPSNTEVSRQKRERRKAIYSPLTPPSLPLSVDAESQTEESLLPKMSLLKGSNFSSPVRQKNTCSSPGGTPRNVLRSKISSLSSNLEGKNICIDDLKFELEEVKELMDFMDQEFKFREESLLAKVEEGTEGVRNGENDVTVLSDDTIIQTDSASTLSTISTKLLNHVTVLEETILMDVTHSSPFNFNSSVEEPSLEQLQSIKEQLLLLQKDLASGTAVSDASASKALWQIEAQRELEVNSWQVIEDITADYLRFSKLDESKIVPTRNRLSTKYESFVDESCGEFLMQDFTFCPDDSILPPQVLNLNSLLPTPAASKPMSFEDEVRMMESASCKKSKPESRLGKSDEIQQLTLRNQELESELSNSLKDIENLKKQLENKQKYDEEMADLKATLDSERIEADSAIEKLKTDLEKYLECEQRNDKEMTDLKATLAAERIEADSTIEKLKTDLEKNLECEQRNEKEMADLKAILDAERIEASLAITKLKTDLEKINTEQDNHAVKQIGSDEVLLEENKCFDVSKLHVENDSKIEIENLSKLIEKLRADLQKSENENEILLSTKQQIEERENSISNELTQTRKTVSELKLAMDKFESVKLVVEEATLNQESQESTSDGQMQQLLDEKIDELRLIEESYKKEVASMTESLRHKEKEKQSMAESLEEMKEVEKQLLYKLNSTEKLLSNLESVAGECEQELQLKERVVDELLQKVKFYEEKNLNDDQKLTDLQKELELSENKLEELRAEHSLLEIQLNELKSSKSQYSELFEENEHHKLLIDELQEAMKDNEDTLEHILQEKISKIADINSKMTALESIKQKLEVENLSLAAELEVQTSQVESEFFVKSDAKDDSVCRGTEQEGSDANIKEKLDSLSLEHSDLKSKLKSKESELQEKIDAFTTLSSEHSDLESKLKSKESELQEKTDAFATLSLEHGDLESKLKSKESELQEEINTLATLTLEHNECKSEMKTIEAELKEERDTLATLSREHSDLQSKLKSTEADLQEKIDALATLTSEHSGCETERKRKEAEYQEERDTLATELNSKEKELNNLSNSLAALTQEHERYILEIKSKEAGILEKTDTLAAHEQKCDELEAKLRSKEAKLLELSDTLDALTFEHSGCNAELKSKEVELEDTQDTLAALTQELCHLKDELKSNEIELREEKNTLVAEVKNKEMELKKMSDTLAALTLEHDGCGMLLKKSEASLAEKCETIEKEQEKLAELYGTIADLQKLEEANNLLVKEKSNLQIQLNLAEEDVKRAAEVKNTETEEQLLRAMESLESAKMNEKSSLTKLERKEKQLAIAEVNLEQLEVDISSLKEELRQTKLKLVDTTSIFKDANLLYAELKCHKIELILRKLVEFHEVETGSVLFEVKNSQDDLVKELREEVSGKVEQLTELSDQLKVMERRCKELEGDVEDALANHKTSNRDYCDKIRDMNAQIGNLEAEKKELTAKNQKLQDQLTAANENKLTDPSMSCDEEVQKLREEIQSCRLQLEEKEQKCQELDAEMDDIVRYYKSSAKDNAEMLRESESKARKLEEDLKEAKLEIERKEQQILQKEEEMQILQSKFKPISPEDKEEKMKKYQDFEEKYQREKLIEDLEERVRMAEAKSSRYLEELRKIQNSDSMNSTICHFQGSHSKKSVPPVVALSSAPMKSLVNDKENSPAYSSGSNMVLSHQVIELKQDVFMLETRVKNLSNEVEHYKTKAQDWKYSSLLHQKHKESMKKELALLKGTSDEEVKPRQEKLKAFINSRTGGTQNGRSITKTGESVSKTVESGSKTGEGNTKTVRSSTKTGGGSTKASGRVLAEHNVKPSLVKLHQTPVKGQENIHASVNMKLNFASPVTRKTSNTVDKMKSSNVADKVKSSNVADKMKSSNDIESDAPLVVSGSSHKDPVLSAPASRNSKYDKYYLPQETNPDKEDCKMQ